MYAQANKTDKTNGTYIPFYSPYPTYLSNPSYSTDLTTPDNWQGNPPFSSPCPSRLAVKNPVERERVYRGGAAAPSEAWTQLRPFRTRPPSSTGNY